MSDQSTVAGDSVSHFTHAVFEHHCEMSTQGAPKILCSQSVVSSQTTEGCTKRRSWFEHGKGIRFDIAVERQRLSCSPNECRSEENTILEEIETLELIHFSRPPVVEFGRVAVGHTESRKLIIKNPLHYDQQVIIEKFPTKKHFEIANMPTELIVRAGEDHVLTLMWSPLESGGCREVVTLKVNDVYRLQFVLLGTVMDMPKSSKKQKSRSRSEVSKYIAVTGPPRICSLQQNYSFDGSNTAGSHLNNIHNPTSDLDCNDESKENVAPVCKDRLVTSAKGVVGNSSRMSKMKSMNRPGMLDCHDLIQTASADKKPLIQAVGPRQKVVESKSNVDSGALNIRSLQQSPSHRRQRLMPDVLDENSLAVGIVRQKTQGALVVQEVVDETNLSQRNRNTFVKYDKLPVSPHHDQSLRTASPLRLSAIDSDVSTPIRRCTFIKQQEISFLADNQIGTSYQHSENYLVRSATPPLRKNYSTHAATESSVDDLYLQNMSATGTPSNLLRSDTYTKLNASLSPSPRHCSIRGPLSRYDVGEKVSTVSPCDDLQTMVVDYVPSRVQVDKIKCDTVMEEDDAYLYSKKCIHAEGVVENKELIDEVKTIVRDHLNAEPVDTGSNCIQYRNLEDFGHFTVTQNVPQVGDVKILQKVWDSPKPPFNAEQDASSPYLLEEKLTALMKKGLSGKEKDEEGAAESDSGSVYYYTAEGTPQESLSPPDICVSDMEAAIVCDQFEDTIVCHSHGIKSPMHWEEGCYWCEEDTRGRDSGKSLTSTVSCLAHTYDQRLQIEAEQIESVTFADCCNVKCRSISCNNTDKEVTVKLFNPPSGDAQQCHDKINEYGISANISSEQDLGSDAIVKIFQIAEKLRESIDRRTNDKLSAAAVVDGNDPQPAPELGLASQQISTNPVFCSNPPKCPNTEGGVVLDVALDVVEDADDIVGDMYEMYVAHVGTNAINSPAVGLLVTGVCPPADSCSTDRHSEESDRFSDSLEQNNSSECINTMNNMGDTGIELKKSAGHEMYSADSFDCQNNIDLLPSDDCAGNLLASRRFSSTPLSTNRMKMTSSRPQEDIALGRMTLSVVKSSPIVRALVSPRKISAILGRKQLDMDVMRDSMVVEECFLGYDGIASLKRSSSESEVEQSRYTIQGSNEGSLLQDSNIMHAPTNLPLASNIPINTRRISNATIIKTNPDYLNAADNPFLPACTGEYPVGDGRHRYGLASVGITKGRIISHVGDNNVILSKDGPKQATVQRSLFLSDRQGGVHNQGQQVLNYGIHRQESNRIEAKQGDKEAFKKGLPVSTAAMKSNENTMKSNQLMRKPNTESHVLRKFQPSAVILPTKKKLSVGPSTLKQRTGVVPGVAQSKLVLVNLTKSKCALPKHPMPYAAKNMYFDERWMEKQERGFVKWLNFILTPPDMYFDARKQTLDTVALCLDTTASAQGSSSTMLAPSKECLSLRAYSVRRRLNRLRRASCALYQSDAVVRVIEKLEREVETGRLAVRPDRMLHADVGLKRHILDLLLSYNPLWLRIGLETIYGEILPLQSNSDVLGLSRFIVSRLLFDPDTSAAFAHPTVPHLYRDGYAAASARFTLKKFLLIVFFLDRAKTTRLIDYNPCLFCKDAEFKSSRELLLLFSRDCLRGEGDITKHLSYIGYTVTNIQIALDEFDFAVANLATDLRDGLRLTRLVEMLTRNWNLSPELRVPAISRLQKIHNVSIVLRELASRGVTVESNTRCGNIDARDIVDGHRQKTLKLLWILIYTFQVDTLIGEAVLQSEIELEMRTMSVECRRRLALMNNGESGILGLVRDKRESLEKDVYYNSPRLSLLLHWCRTICVQYNMDVDNFTVSFSDGRALCYLLHHYHPSLLPLDLIQTRTTLTYGGRSRLGDEADGGEASSDDSHGDDDACLFAGDANDFETLFANEKHNFKVLQDKLTEIGGVPFMLKTCDMSNTIPDEKLVITYVSYLCARLLDIRHEIRAAHTIQAAWRRHNMRRKVDYLVDAVKRALLSKEISDDQIKKDEPLNNEGNSEPAQIPVVDFKTNVMNEDDPDLIGQEYSDTLIKRTSVYDKDWKVTYSDALLSSGDDSRLLQEEKIMKAVSPTGIPGGLKESFAMMDGTRSADLSRECIHSLDGTSVDDEIVDAEIINQPKIGHPTEAYNTDCKSNHEEHASGCAVDDKSLLCNDTRIDEIILDEADSVLLEDRSVDSLSSRLVVCEKTTILVEQQTSTCKEPWELPAYQSQQDLVQTEDLALEKHVPEIYVDVVSDASLEQSIASESLLLEELEIKDSSRVIYSARRPVIIRHAPISDDECLVVCDSCAINCTTEVAERDTVVVTDVIDNVMGTQHEQNFNLAHLNTINSSVHINEVEETCDEDKDNFDQLDKETELTDTQCDNDKLAAAAIILQRHWCAVLARRRCYNEYHTARGAALTIQRWLRHIRAKQLLELGAALTIQRSWRQFVTKRQCSRFYKTREENKNNRQMEAEVLAANELYEPTEIGNNNLILHSPKKNSAENDKMVRERMELRKLEQQLFDVEPEEQKIQQAKDLENTRLEAVAQRCEQLQRGNERFEQERMIFESSERLVTETLQQERLHNDRIEQERLQAELLETENRLTERLKEQRLKEERLEQTRLEAERLEVERYEIMKCKEKRLDVERMTQERLDVEKLEEERLVAETLKKEKLKLEQQRFLKYVIIIQRKWCAILLGRQVRFEYKLTLGATLTIQSAFRRILGRKHYDRLVAERKRCLQMSWAATILQQRYRARILGAEERQCYIKLKWATITVQQQYRAKKLAMQECASFLQLKNAVVRIQQHFRARRLGLEQRSSYVELQQAALTLQRQYRARILGSQQRQVYLRLRFATVKVQQRFRAKLIGSDQRQTYLKLQQTAVTLQRHYRATVVGIAQRKMFLNLKKAAVTVQQRYRAMRIGSAQRQAYVKHIEAAVTLQQRYRAKILGSAQRQTYLKQQDAAIKIQRQYRAKQLELLQRQAYLKLQKAALTIQKQYRAKRSGTVQRLVYLKQREAAIKLQQKYRARRLGLADRQAYLKLKDAVTTVQHQYRARLLGSAQRQIYLKQRASAVKIQRLYRARCMGLIQQQMYLNMKKAATTLQKRFRARRLGQAVRAEYLQLRGATLVVQERYRMRIMAVAVRTGFLGLRLATVRIQQQFRAWRAGVVQRIIFLQLKQAVLTIQRQYRAKKASRDLCQRYCKLKKSVLTIQHHFRAKQLARIQREKYINMKGAAVILQRRYRARLLGYQQRKQYAELKRTTIIIQQYFRAKKLAMAQRRHYVLMRQAAVTIQQYYRAKRLASEERTNFLQIKCAAIVIQQCYRRRRVTLTQRANYLRLKQAALSIQKQYRARVTGLVQRRYYQKLKQAVIIIQQRFRAKRVMLEQRRCYLEQKRSAIAIQQWYRAERAAVETRKSYLELKYAAAKIQQLFRARQLALKQREYFLKIKRAAVAVQQQYRSRTLAMTQRGMYLRLKQATISIQQCYRARKLGLQQRQCYRELKQAAVIIQQRFRARRQAVDCKKYYMALKCSAVVIQRCFRANKAASEQLKNYKQLRQAAITIQRQWRARRLALAQRNRYVMLKSAAVVIQQRYRAWKSGLLQRRYYLKLKGAAVVLQLHFRSRVLALQHRNHYLSMKRAALMIQRQFRSNKVAIQLRQRYCCLREAAIVVQRRYRAAKTTAVQRQSYIQFRTSTIIVQSFFRSYRQRVQYCRQRNAVTIIQSYFRGYRARILYQQYKSSAVQKLEMAAICLQRHYRGYRARKTAMALKQYRVQRLAALTTVTLWHLSAVVIQRVYRKRLALKTAQRNLHAVVTIQRWFRLCQERVCYVRILAEVITLQQAARLFIERRHCAARVVGAAVRRWMLARRLVTEQKSAIVIQSAWRGHAVRLRIKDRKVVAARSKVRNAALAATEENKLCNRTSSALDFLLKYKQLSYVLQALMQLDTVTRLSPQCCVRMTEGNAVSVILKLIRSCNRSLPHMELVKYSVSILLNLSKTTEAAVFEADDSVETLVEILHIYREKCTPVFSSTCMLLGIMGLDTDRRLAIQRKPHIVDRLQSLQYLIQRKQQVEDRRLVAKSKMAAAASTFSCNFGSPTSRRRRIRPDWAANRRDTIHSIDDPYLAVQFMMNCLHINTK